MITENNIKLVLLPSLGERNSLYNTECGSAAVALITPSIQPEPQVLAALIRHMASRTRAGVMNAAVSTTKYPPVPLVSLLLAPSYLLKLHHGLSCAGTGQVLSAAGWWGRGGVGGCRGAWTNGAFIAVGSGCLRTDNGLILPSLKQIAVCSLSGEHRALEAGHRGFCGQDEGEIPKGGCGRVALGTDVPPAWRSCVGVCLYSLSHLETEATAARDMEPACEDPALLLSEDLSAPI